VRFTSGSPPTGHEEAPPIEETLDTIDTHCTGLQSQLEAGSRAAYRIGREAARRESMTAAELRQAALIGSMARRVRELRECIHEQLATLADLRFEVARLRGQLHVRPASVVKPAVERDQPV